MRLIDSHTHLDFPHFDADREAVIGRAREGGLVALLNVGASLDSSRASVALAERHDLIYAAVGIHPHEATAVTPAALDALRGLASHPKVVAIGEIGLDYYRDLSPRDAQRKAFAEQLALAAELGLPVVIHSRDALDDVLGMLRDWQGRGVFHSYAGGPERLDEVLELGFAISIAGPVTFPKAEGLRAVAAAVPLERLLVETDCPYLTPEPHRGRRNEPAHVRHVVEAIAGARTLDGEQVALQTAHNAQVLFGFGVHPGSL